MNLQHIARFVDLFSMAFVFGATAWFFFVQSPVLLKMVGREAFVPIQMRLTIVLFKTLTILLLIMVAAAVAHNPIDSTSTVAAGVALVAGLVNKFFVVPKALRAGGQSRKDIKGMDSEGSTANFASEGAGDRTRLLHRLVVVFVVIMVGGIVVHGITLPAT